MAKPLILLKDTDMEKKEVKNRQLTFTSEIHLEIHFDDTMKAVHGYNIY